METRDPLAQAKKLQGLIVIEVDGVRFTEGTDFAMNRVTGQVFLLRDSELGDVNDALRLEEPLVPQRPKKAKRRAQWKSR